MGSDDLSNLLLLQSYIQFRNIKVFTDGFTDYKFSHTYYAVCMGVHRWTHMGDSKATVTGAF